MTGAPPPPIHRERLPLKLEPELVSWAELHAQPGGLFGSYSHAVERALVRLLLEYDTLREGCAREGVPFNRAAFAALYRAELEATAPSKGGRPPKTGEREPGKERAYATVAVDLVAQARAAFLDNGPFEAMSQVVEVGLMHLRDEAATTASGPRNPFDPEAWWARYRQESAIVGAPKRR
ncbi:MAG: hypothetical protein LC623_04905 [Halobacteriales archaeon]|nr:hypothetical protein [Halobacteriales archaeon]